MSDSIPAAVETLLTLPELQERLEARTLAAGELVRARIVSADAAAVTVDVDGTRGVVPRSEFGEQPTPGGEVELYVDDPDAAPVELSRHKAVRLALWRWLEELRRSGDTVQATVINDRGDDLSVDIGGIKATLPRRELAPGRSREPGALLGESMPVRVLRIREKKAQVIVSERAPVMADRTELKAQTLATLEPGQLVEGEVVRLVNFGAFVDIGGTDGLLHINDMSHRRLRTPSEAVDVGDVITVKVLSYDRESEKIALGLKQTLPDPWTLAEERYRPGAHVTGEVVGLTKFGAFIMLADGIEGLAHISEMAWGKSVQRPGEVVSKGDRVDAWVVRVDPEQRRLGLTLLDPADNPWTALAERLPLGTRLETTVARVADFGIFVSLDADNGLDGLVHENDFSWGPLTRRPRELYKAGDPIEVMVLDIEPERGRATLGIKQLHEDLTSELIRKYTVGQKVEGTITSLKDFGAFIELEPGLEGLIPISAMAVDHVEHPEDLVKAGERVTAAITRIDRTERKISLTLVGHGLPERAPAVEDAPADEAAPAVEDAPAEEAAPAAEAAPADDASPAAEVAEAPADDAAPAADDDGVGQTAPYGAAISDAPAPAPAEAPEPAPKGETARFAALPDDDEGSADAPVGAVNAPAEADEGASEPAKTPEGEPGA